jgi:parallel beta-helix repeat protein
VPTYDQLLAAQNYAHMSNVEAMATGLPPGFGAGFKVTWEAPNLVKVGPGAANVDGQQVAIDEEILIDDSMWLVVRVQGHFYIYLTSAGEFEVDTTGPIQSTDNDFHNYHPITGARFIGRLYVDSDGDQVFAATGTKAVPEVIVGAFAWTDDSDYLCDGTGDDVEVNAAIRYLSGAFGGGIVRLSPGTFNLSSEISMLGSITLEGSGYGTRIVPNSTAGAQSYGIHVPGTLASPIGGCVIRDLRVQRSARNVFNPAEEDTGPDDIFAEYANDIIIENNWIIDSPFYGISVTYSKDFLVSGNIVRDAYGTVEEGVAEDEGVSVSLGGGSTDTLLSGRVVNNEIYNTAEVGASLTGIAVIAPGKVLIANNVVRNLLGKTRGSGFKSSVRGISANGSVSTISGNLIFDLRNSDEDTDGCRAIELSGDAANCHVVGNTIRDVRGFPSSDPNEAGTGVFLTRDGGAVPNDAHIASNFIHGCDQGVFIEDAGTDIYRVMLSGNQVYDCGQLINHGHCEQTASGPDSRAPMVLAETTPVTTNVTSWARSTEQVYEGAYSYKLVKSSSSGAGDCEAYVVDSNSSTEMHGLLAGVEYTYECWVYVPSSGGPSSLSEVEIRAYYYDGAWQNAAVSPTGYNAWEKLTLTQAIPADATGSRGIRFAVQSAAEANEYAYFDNVRLYPTKNQNAHENLLKDEGTDTRF